MPKRAIILATRTKFWSAKMALGTSSAVWSQERRNKKPHDIQKWRLWEYCSLKSETSSVQVIKEREAAMELLRLEVELIEQRTVNSIIILRFRHQTVTEPNGV